MPDQISAVVILDSVSPAGKRLTTLELNMPRFVLAQFNTHRAFSRNAASSRAIPTAQLIERVRANPFVPAEFGANQRGMQAGEALPTAEANEARIEWETAAEHAWKSAAALADYGVHKQWANRLLEPFLWVKVLVSATEWANFWRLRLHDDAQPEFQTLARAIFEAREGSEPMLLLEGEWHLPYLTNEEETEMRIEACQHYSVARCARLGLSDRKKDEELYQRLLTGSGFGHWSPFEHVATPRDDSLPFRDGTDPREGNYSGWIQYRKMFNNECAREEESPCR
jgi:thymidylate synthase ThyX